MSDAEFFAHLNHLSPARRPDLLEQDYHLHRLLVAISGDEFLRNNLVFKGGTCLVKAYTRFFRFSEDLDFTWRDATLWEGRSKSRVAKDCSRLITLLLERFQAIGVGLGLRPPAGKGDSEGIEIGSGGRMVRLFLRYASRSLGVESKIKIEINLVEKLLFQVDEQDLRTYAADLDDEEIAFVHPRQWSAYLEPVTLACYDPREILAEKGRAILTRRGFKARDLLDLIVLQRDLGIRVEDYLEAISTKVRFGVDLYQRYQENLERPLPADDELTLGDAELLLLEQAGPVPWEEGKRIMGVLRELRLELVGEGAEP